MLSYIDWLFTGYHYLPYIIMFVLWGSLGAIIMSGNWVFRLKSMVAYGILCGALFGGMSTSQDYRLYKNNMTTCMKPAAMAAGYVFDAQSEKCMKPFVGYVPVSSYGNIEVKPKPNPITI